MITLATVASFNVALVASTGRFVSAMSQAERQWNNFSRSVQKGAKQLPKAIQEATPAALTLARHLSQVAAVAGALMTGMGAWGVVLAGQMEQSRIAFETLLGSAERADRFLRELEVYARRTPFGFVGLQDSARKLLAYGFTADRVLSMITPIGDAVAAMGGSPQMLEQIIRALGQMQAKQKVSAEEMLQLTETGIGAWQMLAEGIGTSVPEAMKRAERGLIPASVAIEAILEGMTKRFGGSMERQADSWLGQWEQFKDAMTTITRGFGEDIVQIFGLADAMRSLNEAVGRFADLVSRRGFIEALREAFPPWLKPIIIGVAGAIGGALVPVIVSWLIPALKKLSVSLWATLRPLLPWMAIGAAVALVAWVLARNWQAAWASISAATLYAASVVVRGVGMMVQALAVVVPGLQGTAQAFRGWADALREAAASQWSVARSAGATAEAAQQGEALAQTADQAAQAQQGLGDAMEQAAKAATSNLQSFDEVHTMQEEMSGAADLLAMPEMSIPAIQVPGIDLTAGVDLGDGLEGAAGGITTALQTVAQEIAGIWSSAAAAIGGAWDNLLATVPGLQAAVEGVNRAVAWIRDNWPTIGSVIENIAGILMLTLVPALIKTGVEATLAGARMVASWVASGLAATVEGAKLLGQLLLLPLRWAALGLTATIEGAKVVAAWVAQGVAAAGSVAQQIVQFALAIGRWVLLGITATVNALRVAEAWMVQQVQALASMQAQGVSFTTLIARWTTLAVQAVTNAARVVAAWVAQKTEAIASAAAQVPQFIRLVGQWIALGAAAAAQAARVVAAWLVQKVQAAASVAAQVAQIVFLAGRLAWLGVQALFHAGRIALAWIIAMGPIAWVVAAVVALAAVIIYYWDEIKAWTIKTWEAVSAWVSETWEAIKTRAVEVWTALMEWFSETWESIRETIVSVWTAIGQWLSDRWEWVRETASRIWGAIKTFFATWWDELLALVTGPVGWLVYLIAHNWDTIRDTTVQVWERVAATLSGVWEGIKNAAARIWQGIVDAIKAPINWVIGLINRFLDALSRIRITVPQVEIPLIGTVGGWSIGLPNIPRIPMLAEGGNIVGSGVALVGEAGPELLELPRGARVTPLSGGDGDLADEVAQAVYRAIVDGLRTVNATNRSGAGDREAVLRINGRDLARVLLPEIIAEGQRQGLQLVIRPQGV